MIYLDDLLILGATEQAARHQLATALNLLESLGFVTYIGKSVLSPLQKIVVSGYMYVNRFIISVPLPSPGQSQKYPLAITVCQLAHLQGCLSSSIQVVCLGPLNYRYLQQAKIQALRSGGHYESRVLLNKETKEELQWWAKNLMNWIGRALAHPNPSMEGWGAHCNGVRTGGLWSQSEQFLHANFLKLLGGSLSLQSNALQRKKQTFTFNF